MPWFPRFCFRKIVGRKVDSLGKFESRYRWRKPGDDARGDKNDECNPSERCAFLLNGEQCVIDFLEAVYSSHVACFQLP